MSRPRKSIPSYLPHAQSGRARAVWSDSSGIRHFRMLPGPIDSKESRSAFTALLLELEAAPHSARSATTNGLLLGELLLTYLDHAERHYRGPGGKPTSEIDEVRVVIRALRELYADKSAAEFGPLCLKAARQRWVADDRSRTECNRRVGIVKRIFKWAVSADLVPATTYQALATVSALQKGRTAAPEKAPIGPVDDVTADTTLPFINRHVCGLVEFQRLTGCRPGEACAVRRCDIDTGGVVWVYRPPHHKNAHRGQARTISVGPKAQELLRAFFTPNLSDYLFSPTRVMDEVRTERAEKRKTPLYPSHVSRNVGKRKGKPQRVPAASYDTQAYGHAVARACEVAFPPPAPLGQRDEGRVVGPPHERRAGRSPGVAEVATLAPEPASPCVRHAGEEDTRTGSRASSPRALAPTRPKSTPSGMKNWP